MNRVEEILEGLKIVNAHEDPDICAEHDIIYIRCEGELSGEELAKLDQLGWTESDAGGWEHFV
jgi:hypothetical protein